MNQQQINNLKQAIDTGTPEERAEILAELQADWYARGVFEVMVELLRYPDTRYDALRLITDEGWHEPEPQVINRAMALIDPLRESLDPACYDAAQLAYTIMGILRWMLNPRLLGILENEDTPQVREAVCKVVDEMENPWHEPGLQRPVREALRRIAEHRSSFSPAAQNMLKHLGEA